MAVSGINNAQSSCRELNNFYHPPSFNLTQRLDDLSAKTSKLFKKISPQEKMTTIRIGSFHSDAGLDGRYSYHMNWQYPFFHVDCSSAEIVLPSYYLFKSEDIPSNFKIQDFDDPRLHDEQYLRSFAEWMNAVVQCINEDERNHRLPLIENPKDHNDFRNLRLFLMLLRDPLLFEKSKEHVIAHELCHGLNKNQSLFIFLETKFNSLPAIGILSGLALCGAGMVFAPFTSLPIGLSLIGSGVALTAATTALTYFGFSKCCAIEKKCDLGAVKALKDARGAIYHFEMIRQLNLCEKAKNPSLPIDDTGNCIYDVYHPFLTSRISYCREWQDEQKD